MHASLILFVASLAAPVVATPMPIQTPTENLVIREVEADPNSPALDVLKREILERLDVIAQHSVPKAHHGYSGSVYDKRVVLSDDHDNVDQRQSSKGYAGSVWDKRNDDSLDLGDTPRHDKRQTSEGDAGSVYDKRDFREESVASLEDEE